MIDNFLIINCIGKDDRLGLRINKDFFVHIFENKNKKDENFVSIIFDFLNKHNVQLNENFSVIVNQGPGSFFFRNKNRLSCCKRSGNIQKSKAFWVQK